MSLSFPTALLMVGFLQAFSLPDGPTYRVEPQFPLAALENGDVAVCRADLLRSPGGTVTVTGVTCAATGSHRAFENASQRAAERWLYAESDREETLQTCFTFRMYGVDLPDHVADFCNQTLVS